MHERVRCVAIVLFIVTGIIASMACCFSIIPIALTLGSVVTDYDVDTHIALASIILVLIGAISSIICGGSYCMIRLSPREDDWDL